MISAEWVTAFATVGMAIAVGIYAYLVYKQTKSFQEQTKSYRKQTEKMDEYIETMRDRVEQEKIKRKREDIKDFIQKFIDSVLHDLISQKEEIEDISQEKLIPITLHRNRVEKYFPMLERIDSNLYKRVKKYYDEIEKYNKKYNESGITNQDEKTKLKNLAPSPSFNETLTEDFVKFREHLTEKYDIHPQLEKNREK